MSRALALYLLCLRSRRVDRRRLVPVPRDNPRQVQRQPRLTLHRADGTRFGVQVTGDGTRRFRGRWRSRPMDACSSPSGPDAFASCRTIRYLPEPALTLTGLHTDGESGVLGLALHPSFATNGFVYIVYDVEGPNGPFARLVRYRAVGNTLAEPAVLLDDVPAANIHNGSRVHFGPDGALYLSFGDAASPSVAQDLARLNGKMLRLERRRDDAAGQSVHLAGVDVGASEPARLRLAPGDRRAVRERARADGQRRNQRDRARGQLWLAGHRRRQRPVPTW